MNIFFYLVGAGCLMLGSLCVWAVLTPKIDDGVIIKIGLILFGLATLAIGAILIDPVTRYDYLGIMYSLGLMTLGGLVLVFGICLKIILAGTARRQLTEWIGGHHG